MEQQPLFLSSPSKKEASVDCDAVIALRSNNFFFKLSAVFLLAVILFIPERPAWGKALDIQFENGAIRGYAHQVALGDILEELARQGGYTVYVDEKLFNAPTTFYIPMAVPAERAIQRIVHPHSIALVFTRAPGEETARIRQIKVFSKGHQSSPYASIAGPRETSLHASYAQGQSSALYGSKTSVGAVKAGMEEIRKHVKSPVVITENAMGFTGFKFKDKQRGPDYRSNTLALTKAYIQHRKDRDGFLVNAESSEFSQAKETSQSAEAAYRADRTASIQQTLSTAKP